MHFCRQLQGLVLIVLYTCPSLRVGDWNSFCHPLIWWSFMSPKWVPLTVMSVYFPSHLPTYWNLLGWLALTPIGFVVLRMCECSIPKGLKNLWLHIIPHILYHWIPVYGLPQHACNRTSIQSNWLGMDTLHECSKIYFFGYSTRQEYRRTLL